MLLVLKIISLAVSLLNAAKRFLANIAHYGKIKTLSFYNDVFSSGKVKRVRRDNGGEDLSKDFQDLLIQSSVKHEITSPYSPHQNGAAERIWCTLFDMARSIILESNLPKYLCKYAVMSATFVRNCCYRQRIDNTPYGLITRLKPNIAKLHVFRSVCYSYIQDSKKLDARSRKVCFVGYDKEVHHILFIIPKIILS